MTTIPDIDPRLKEAMDWHTAGQFDLAWDRYSLLEKENPKDADVVHLMGVLAGQVGNLMESVARINQAIKLNPKSPDFHKNLSITLRRLGDKTKAAEALINMGNALGDQNRLEEAVAAFLQAWEVDPKNEHAPNNLGVMLNKLGRYGEAYDYLTKALAPDPRMPRALAHWNGEELPGGFLRQLPSVHLNLGNALHGLGRIDEAIEAHRRALSINPEIVEGHNDIALALLLAGQYEEGWREFEWRWQEEKYSSVDFIQPQWNGQSAAELDGPLFVLSEQGFGDAIMLCRYLPFLAAQGHDVLFEVKPALWSLFAEGLATDRIRLVPAATGPRGYDSLHFAAYTGTFSLPRLFGTTIDTVPNDVPYLSVSQERIARWAEKLHDPRGRKKIGIVWGGNPLHLKNFERSMPPEFLHDVLARDDVAFYSLQKGPAATYPFPGGNVTVLDEALTDFAETAAAISNLDLVIGVDTAVVHLAGALGKPVWVMLAHVPDWRWLMGRDTSPWYPTARLFRQHRHGDWHSLATDLRRALDDFA
jgi:Flp pilus assembly protein TadD